MPITWEGDTNADWADGANWGGTAPADNTIDDIATFNIGTYGGNPVFNPVITGTRSVNGVDIQAGNGNMTLSGGTLTLGSGNLNVASAGDTAISAFLAGSTNINKSGAGNLTLSGNNTFTTSGAAGIDIAGGRVAFSSENHLGNTTNDITLGSGGALSYTGGANLALNSGRVITVGTGGGTIEVTNSTRTLTLGTAGQLATSANTLTKAGDGALTISANNTGFSGAVNVDAGTLNLNSRDALGQATKSVITLAGGTTLGLFTVANTASTNFGNDVVLGGNATINPGRSAAGTNQLAIMGTLSLGSTLTITGDSNNVDVQFGATTFTNHTTLAVNNVNRDLILGAITESGAGDYSLTKNGSGTLYLTGNNSYGATGLKTIINAGAVSIASTASLPGWNVAGRYSVENGAYLAVGNAVTEADLATMLATGSFGASAGFGYDTTAGNRTIAGVVSGGRNFIKLGQNTLTLTDATYSGTTFIQHGAGLGNALPAAGGVAYTGILELVHNTDRVIAGAFTGSGILQLSGAGNVTFNGGANNTNGPLGLILSGTGTTTVSTADANFSGGTTVGTNQTLIVNSSRVLNLGAVNGGNNTIIKQDAGRLDIGALANLTDLRIEGGTVRSTSATTGTGNITFATNGVSLEHTGTAAGTTLNFAANGVLNGSNGGDQNPTISSKITGTGNITFIGGQFFSAYLTPAADSDWLGNLIVGAGAKGIVRIANQNLNYTGAKGISLLTVTGATGFSNPTLVDGGASGAVRIRTDVTIGGLNTAGDGVNTRISSNGLTSSVPVLQTLTINLTSGSQTYDGALSDGYNGSSTGGVSPDLSTLKLIKTGAGTQTISGQTYLSNYSGGTDIDGGTLVVNGGGAAVTGLSGSNGTANIGNGSSRTFAVASTDGLYVGKQVTLVNGGAAPANVFISAISGLNVTITNRSGGTLTTLVGANTFDFGASSPTGTGAVNVNNTGTLKGNGTIAGELRVNAGGALSPGNSIGALTSGNSIWDGNSTFELELSTDGSTGAAGTEWDLLAVTGGLNLSNVTNTAGDRLTVRLFTMANSTTTGPLGAWNENINHTWAGFITTTAGITGFAADKFLFNTAGWNGSLAGNFSVAQNGNNLDLIYTAIPEPSMGLMMLGGFGMLALLRRRSSAAY